MGGKRISKELKQKVLELFQKGFSYRTIAPMLGLSWQTVRDWHLLFRSSDTSWVEPNYCKTNVSLLQNAVDEYLNTEQGCNVIAVKYGIRRSILLAARRNFVNFGVFICLVDCHPGIFNLVSTFIIDFDCVWTFQYWSCYF